MTQLEIILNHLKKTGSITRREALIDYSIQNITACMSSIRQLGYEVLAHPKKHPTTGQRYMRYTLGDRKNNQMQQGSLI